MPEQQPEAAAQFSRSFRQLIAQARTEGLPVRAIRNELERLIRELSS
jgi:hypothetical protein